LAFFEHYPNKPSNHISTSH